MGVTIGFSILTVLLALLAVVFVWYWFTKAAFFAPLPCPFCNREANQDEWRKRFDDEGVQRAEVVLGLVCDAFSFDPDERYKFNPDDKIMDIYRGRYLPSKVWPKGDCMEIETLMLLLDQRFGIESSEWHPDLTFSGIIDLAAKKPNSDDTP